MPSSYRRETFDVEGNRCNPGWNEIPVLIPELKFETASRFDRLAV